MISERVRVAIGGLLVLFATLAFGRFGYGLILPSMQHALSLTNTEAGEVATAQNTSYFLSAFFGGYLAPKLGFKRLIFTTVTLAGVGSILTGLAGTFEYVLIAQLLVGSGSGAATISSIALSGLWFGVEGRGKGLGIVNSGPGVGLLAAGPLLSYILQSGLGWRYAWYTAGVVILLVAGIGSILIKNPTVHALNTDEDGGNVRKVLRNKMILLLGIIYSTFGIAYSGYATFLPAFVINSQSWSQETASILWLIWGAMQVTGSLTLGIIGDRVGRGRMLALGMVLFTTAFPLVVLANSPMPIFLSALIYGFFFTTGPTFALTEASDKAGRGNESSAVGLVSLIFGVGQAIGPYVAGMTVDMTGTYSSVFTLGTTILALGAALAILNLRLRSP